jgi:hypothetical protein
MQETFIEELKAYREPVHHLLGDGLSPTHPSGNALLYESHAAQIVQDMGYEPGLTRIYEALDILRAGIGLYNRKPPPATDPQAHDDYTGAAAINPASAANIVLRGETMGWVYDNRRPYATFWKAIAWIGRGSQSISYLKYWHARLPGQIQHYQIGARQSPSVLGWLSWMGSIMWTVRKPSNESGWLLDYLKLRTGIKHFPTHWAVKVASWWYKRQLNKHYSGCISHVYAVYFGAEHPLARYSAWPKKH